MVDRLSWMGQAQTAMTIPHAPRPRILVLHGIWNRQLWLWPLLRRLRTAGFDAHAFGYASVCSEPAAAMSRLAEQLHRDNVATCLIGHSLGGLIALETLSRWPELAVPRVVCLGTPLQGSHTAQALMRRRGTKWTLGRSAALLQAGSTAWPGRVQVGMVAGNLSRGLGRLLTRLDGPSDGTVTVAETRLPGLTDHCIVNASHSSLIFSLEAARQSMHFLLHGRFALNGRISEEQ